MNKLNMFSILPASYSFRYHMEKVHGVTVAKMFKYSPTEQIKDGSIEMQHGPWFSSRRIVYLIVFHTHE